MNNSYLHLAELRSIQNRCNLQRLVHGTKGFSLVPRPHPLKEGKVWCAHEVEILGPDRTEDEVSSGLYEFYYVVKSLRLQVQCS